MKKKRKVKSQNNLSSSTSSQRLHTKSFPQDGECSLPLEAFVTAITSHGQLPVSITIVTTLEITNASKLSMVVTIHLQFMI